MSRKLKFAVLGCGRVAKKHLEPLKRHIDGVELVAVCDKDKEKARITGKEYEVPHYSDYQEMLRSQPDIDVVNILTDSGSHAEHTVAIAQFGKHVVVEKPMALTIEDAEEMIRACDKNNVRLFVVKQNRFNLPVQKLREAIEQERFGKLVLGTVRVRWCRTQEYYDQDEWRGKWETDGGVIANQASHHIDMLTWMMGDVEKVFCYTSTRLVNIEADDTAVAVIRFVNGALGIIEATTATRPKDLEGSVSILGEGGSVEVGGFAMNEMKVWQFSKPEQDDKEVLERYKENPPNVYGFGHTRFLVKVADSIRNNRGGAVDGLEGLKSLILINAMYESMETGKEVTVRFRPNWAKLGKKNESLR